MVDLTVPIKKPDFGTLIGDLAEADGVRSFCNGDPVCPYTLDDWRYRWFKGWTVEWVRTYHAVQKAAIEKDYTTPAEELMLRFKAKMWECFGPFSHQKYQQACRDQHEQTHK